MSRTHRHVLAVLWVALTVGVVTTPTGIPLWTVVLNGFLWGMLTTSVYELLRRR